MNAVYAGDTDSFTEVEPMYIMSRMIFIRESSSKMYSQLVFTTSMLIAEMPYSLLCAVTICSVPFFPATDGEKVLFFVCIYYPVGLQHVTYKAGFQFLMILITELFSVILVIQPKQLNSYDLSRSHSVRWWLLSVQAFTLRRSQIHS